MPRNTPGPFAHSSGPRDAKIAIIGEAWGKDEDLVGRPFMGASGQELTRMLREAGIPRGECFLTNVLALRPPGNNLELLCETKAVVGKDYPFPPLSQGKYLGWEYLPEIQRLKEELSTVRPNLCIALGNTATWALLGTRGISAIRGVVANSTLLPGLKVLPTYHPSAILRNWSWRVIAIADLMKAARESKTPELSRPARRVLVDPTLGEIHEWISTFLPSALYLAVDTETAHRQIDMVGFACSPTEALVVPFFNNQTYGNYWPDEGDEVAARKAVQTLLGSSVPKIFQNGLYDLQYFVREGFRVANVAEDTMLQHHSLYPEMQKSLGFLGSLYCNEPAWKLMRKRGDDVLKKDE